MNHVPVNTFSLHKQKTANINGKNLGFPQGCKSHCNHTSKTAKIKIVLTPLEYLILKGPINACFLRPYHTMNALTSEHQEPVASGVPGYLAPGTDRVWQHPFSEKKLFLDITAIFINIFRTLFRRHLSKQHFWPIYFTLLTHFGPPTVSGAVVHCSLACY